MTAIYAIVFGLLAMIGYGLSDYVAAIASRRIGFLRASLVPLTISLVLSLAIFVLFFHLPAISFYTWIAIAGMSLGSVLGLLAYYKGFEVGNVSIVAPLGSAWPVVTVILALIFLSQQLTQLEVVGIILLISGTIIASTDLSALRKMGSKSLSKGASWGILTMFCWGFTYFMSAVLVQTLGWFIPVFLMVILMTAYIIPFYRPGKREILKIRSAFVLCIIVALLELSIFLSYNVAVLSGNAVIVAPITAASPIITIGLAVLLLKEKVKRNEVIGIIAILLGLILLAI